MSDKKVLFNPSYQMTGEQDRMGKSIRNNPGGGDARTLGGQVDRGQSSRKRPTVDCCNTAIFRVIIINNNNVNCDRNSGHNNNTMYNMSCYWYRPYHNHHTSTEFPPLGACKMEGGELTPSIQLYSLKCPDYFSSFHFILKGNTLYLGGAHLNVCAHPYPDPTHH